jgi:sarcosine dehydrogenase
VAARPRRAPGVRDGVGLIDQTSFAKFEITGPGALAAVQWLSVADMDKPVGTVIYTQLCNERGGIECDLTMIRTAPDSFYVVTGSAFGAHDMGWIRTNSPDDGSVIVATSPRRERSSTSSARRAATCCSPCARTTSATPRSSTRRPARSPSARRPCWPCASATSGELGWELHIPTEYAAHVYELLHAAGQAHGIVDVGYRTIDTMRMEKGYVYWSTDVTPDTTPWEAGLGWRVNLNKGDFLGRDALVAQQEAGPPASCARSRSSRWRTP